MTTDLKDVLMELDGKISEVYDLGLAEEMTDIYIDLTDRVNELSSQYWKLVKALTKTEKDRDDLVREKDQAEYDRDYYRNEIEWHRKEAEKERRLRVAAEYEKELAEMELLGQEVRYDLDD